MPVPGHTPYSKSNQDVARHDFFAQSCEPLLKFLRPEDAPSEADDLVDVLPGDEEQGVRADLSSYTPKASSVSSETPDKDIEDVDMTLGMMVRQLIPSTTSHAVEVSDPALFECTQIDVFWLRQRVIEAGHNQEGEDMTSW